MAQLNGMIDWQTSSVDGCFSSGKGSGEQVNSGYKGKGVTIHSLVDGEGNPLVVLVAAANESERCFPC